MPQACTICRHERQAEIDQLLVAGTSLRNIAQHFGTSATALHRHKKHLAPALAVAKEAAQAADAGTLLEKVSQLLVDAQRLTSQAEQAKQLDVALRGIREVRGVLELLGKVSSELAKKTGQQPDGSINIGTPEENEAAIAVLLAKATAEIQLSVPQTLPEDAL
jgi:hypothetical protein